MNDVAATDDTGLPSYLYDGYLVHTAVLAKGLDVLALPRQVLLAGMGDPVPAQISFTHGVPEASTLSAVTFAQDQRLRRALVQREGVAVPRGATFTWRSLEQAQEWARKVGFPVVVKDAAGENPARSVHNVTDAPGLTAAFKLLRRRRPEDRSPGSNPHLAGYAATRLGYTIDDDGNEVAPLRTRMLVEQQVCGPVLRAAVVDDSIVAAVIHAEDGVVVNRPLPGEIPERVAEEILRAARAIPGLGFAMIDAVVSRTPGGAEEVVVVEVAERPRLETFAAVDPGLAEEVATRIVEYQATRAGVELGPDLQTLRGRLIIEGFRDVTRALDGLITRAQEFSVDLAAEETDEVGGSLVAAVTGRPRDIATVVEHLMAGTLINDRAMSVEYRNDGAK